MAITIKVKNSLYAEQEHWLAKNVGPRLHYLHNSIGGEGWIAKKGSESITYTDWNGKTHNGTQTVWNLTFEDERFATWFRIMFPE